MALYSIVQSAPLVLVGFRENSLDNLATIGGKGEIHNDRSFVAMKARVGFTHFHNSCVESDGVLLLEDLEDRLDRDIMGSVDS